MVATAGPISQVQRKVKLRGPELLAYFGKGIYDFGQGFQRISHSDLRMGASSSTTKTLVQSPGFQPGSTLGTSLNVRTKHRLEAYAPLAFRTVERSPRAIPGPIAVHLE